MDTNFKEKLIKTCLFTPGFDDGWGINMTFWGEPATVKSALTVKVAAELGLVPIVLAPNGRAATDIIGLPYRNAEKGCTAYVPPEWAMDAAKIKHALIFIDERNTAPPSVQAPLLRMLRDKVVGDFQLPPEVRFLSACNPTEQAANGWDESAALANRSGHITWLPPSPKDWANAMGRKITAVPGSAEAKAHISPDATVAQKLEAQVLKQWPEESAKAFALVSSYLERRPAMMHNCPKDGDPEASKSWPSARTWELAVRGLAGGRIHGMDVNEQMQMVSAFVGETAACDFMEWVTKQDLPNPVDLLTGKATFAHDRSRGDRTYAVLSSCTSLCKATVEKGKQKAYVEATWKLIGVLSMTDPDTVVGAIGDLIRGEKEGMAKVRNADYRKVMDDFQDVVKMAHQAR